MNRRRNVRRAASSGASEGRGQAFLRKLVRMLMGAIIVAGVMIAFAYGWLRFDLRPRTSAISVCVGLVAFIYAALNLGKAIVVLGQLRPRRGGRGEGDPLP